MLLHRQKCSIIVYKLQLNLVFYNCNAVHIGAQILVVFNPSYFTPLGQWLNAIRSQIKVVMNGHALCFGIVCRRFISISHLCLTRFSFFCRVSFYTTHL